MAATCAPLAGTASEGRPKLGSQSRRRRSWLAVTVGLATIFATVAVTAATAPPSSAATPGIITTVAGGDAPGPVPATDVAMGASGEIAAGGGNVYVPDDQFHVIRAIATSGGSETVVAGNGTEGSLGNGGPATEAELKGPQGVAVGGGDVVIADTSNDAVRITDASTGDLLTVAGDGTAGYTGDGGPCTSAELDGPYGVALDSAGNIIIADTGNDAIRVVASSTGTYYGVAMTLGDIYTVAGGHGAGYSGDAGPATAATLDYPEDVFADSLGDIVIADTYNNAIRVVAGTTGTIYGISMTAGDIYTVAGGNGAGSSGNQGPALAAQLSSPQSVALDDAGDIIIADTGNNAIRLVAAGNGGGLTEGYIYTVAGVGRTAGFSGDGGAATSAELSSPEGVAVDGSGNLVISDFGNERVRVIAATTGTFYGISMNAGDIYTIAGNGFAGYSGDGGAATQAEMRYPSAVAVDSYGNYVIAEPYDSAIRVTANSTGTFYGVAMTAGDVYTVAGDGAPGYSGDGGPATEAALDLPFGVGMDGSGNIIIADTGNQRLRVIAKSTGTFYGQAMTAGDIYTIAGNGAAGYSGDGGPATAAELGAPWGATVDGAGNVLVTDPGNSRVRVVAESTGTFYGQAMTTGDIYTIAGDTYFGYAGDGGPATSASLWDDTGVAVDNAGDVVIADFGNNRIRLVTGGPVVPALSFGPLSVTSWTVNQSGFPGTIALSGGTGSYSLTAQSGLPAGLTATLAGSTISITGTPTQAGTFASGSLTVRDSTGATATDSFSVTINNKATPTLVTKPGATSVTLGKTAPTLTDTATVSGGSNPTGTVTFTLYYDGGASPVYTSPAVALNKGSASASYTLPGTTVQVAGTYQWDATYSGDTNNNSVSDNNDQAELVTVTAAGEFAFGAGWYTPSPSVGSTSFGFVVVPGPKSTYSGQLNVVTANRWWYQANVTSYGKTSKSEGLLAGTGSLYSWSSALNKGRGGWQLVASGVTYKATANAGTNSSASFAIVVNYTASGLPNSSSPITLARGGITII